MCVYVRIQLHESCHLSHAEVYASVALLHCLCSHHHYTVHVFVIPNGNAGTPIPPPHPQLLITFVLLSVSTNWPVLDIWWRWTHTLLVFRCLAYLTWHIFPGSACGAGVSASSLSMAGQCCVTQISHMCLSTCLLVNIWVVSMFGLLWRLLQHIIYSDIWRSSAYL